MKTSATSERKDRTSQTSPVRSGRQIGAARALAGLSLNDLASLGGWQPGTLRGWEAQAGVPAASVADIEKLVQIFAAQGVAFVVQKTSVGVRYTSSDPKPSA